MGIALLTLYGGNDQYLACDHKTDLVAELILFMCLSLGDTTGKGFVRAVGLVLVRPLLVQYGLVKFKLLGLSGFDLM